MQSKFIQYKNKNIHYRVAGKGRPVVLLHGMPLDGTVWDNIAGELRNNYSLIIPDIPGSGRSERLEDNARIENYAEVVKAILDNEHTGETCIIGHSLGGYIALAFAEKYPELLSGLGLFHSSAFADNEERIQVRLKAIEFIKTNGAYAFLKALIPNLFADKQHPYIEKLIEKCKDFDAEALIQYYEAMIARPDRTEVLKTTTRPVLFIIGEKDTAVPMQASLLQCHLPAISYVHILEKDAHMGMIESAKECAAFIISFLKNVSLTGTMTYTAF